MTSQQMLSQERPFRSRGIYKKAYLFGTFTAINTFCWLIKTLVTPTNANPIMRLLVLTRVLIYIPL
jgi:hypothetical protein